MADNKIGVGFGVMILRDGKVLLGRRNEDPEKASSLLRGEGTWTMPGGKLDFSESLKEGAIREVAEETGIKVTSENLELISLSDDLAPNVHFVTAGFLCTEFLGEASVMEPEEIVEWNWFRLDDLPNPIYPPSEKVINAYNSKKIYQ